MLEDRSDAISPLRSNGVLWGAVVLIVVLVAGLMFAYSAHQRSVAQQQQLEKEQMQAALTQTHQEIDALNLKLTAMTQAQQQQAAAEAQQLQAQRAAASRSAVVRRRADDKRWKDMQGRVDAQGQAIDQTRADLSTAKTELSSSIARTHGELVQLQRKGERNYYEFDLDKSKQFTRTGPMGVALRKADTKHQYADLELMVEDTKLQKKHVNLFEPVMFYRPDTQTPVELVINSVKKNHIHGYISEPKYRNSELQAAASGDSSNVSTSSNAGAKTPNGQPELRRRNQ
jgi:cbb3-type cytochrome oxidase subunit 3